MSVTTLGTSQRWNQPYDIPDWFAPLSMMFSHLICSVACIDISSLLKAENYSDVYTQTHACITFALSFPLLMDTGVESESLVFVENTAMTR